MSTAEMEFDDNVQAYTICGLCGSMDWCVMFDIELCKKCYLWRLSKK